MQWLTYYLKLNPMKHACDALCRHISQITRSPRSVEELKLVALIEERDIIPPKDIMVV